MGISTTFTADPAQYLAQHLPDAPVLFFSPEKLAASTRVFQDNFPGLVTFAVKANPDRMVLENLQACGIRAFDVASTAEIALLRDCAPNAVLNYNNPIRSRAELQFAKAAGVSSYSVDRAGELAKLAEIIPPENVEVSVRLKLPVSGSAYDFGSKFGATPELAAELLREAAQLGYTPSITFHPGSQCENPEAWGEYISAAAEVARNAGVTLKRLNVGGGFPSHRNGKPPDLSKIFASIKSAVAQAFGPNAPELLCEPGRALVAECITLATRVKAIGDDGAVFLNDGIYGALSELPLVGMTDRVETITAQGRPIDNATSPRLVFGPTCDSFDVLPAPLPLPSTIAEEDYILFHGFGAYSAAVATRFNGYGHAEVVTVLSPRP